ncbi:MAG: hypothetical protein ABW321_25720 [Polyangiales bacterium]
MSDKLIDVRTPLAASDDMRVEIGRDGLMYVVTPSVSLHLDRVRCEELTHMLARAMVRLRKLEAARMTPRLRMVKRGAHHHSQEDVLSGETASRE